MITYSGKLKSMLPYFRSKKGFTLIELLIVVAIISILVSIGAVSFSRVQIQGRDTTRKADLQEVASALEQFYSDNNAYPEDNGGQITCGGTTIPWGGPDTFCLAPIYLDPLPKDPGSNTYFYDAQGVSAATCDNNPATIAVPSCQRFVISSTLEGTVPTIACTPRAPGTFNFCVKNP